MKRKIRSEAAGSPEHEKEIFRKKMIGNLPGEIKSKFEKEIIEVKNTFQNYTLMNFYNGLTETNVGNSEENILLLSLILNTVKNQKDSNFLKFEDIVTKDFEKFGLFKYGENQEGDFKGTKQRINLQMLGEYLRAYSINGYNCPLGYESLDKVILEEIEKLKIITEKNNKNLLIKNNGNYINSFKLYFEGQSEKKGFGVVKDYQNFKTKLGNYFSLKHSQGVDDIDPVSFSSLCSILEFINNENSPKLEKSKSALIDFLSEYMDHLGFIDLIFYLKSNIKDQNAQKKLAQIIQKKKNRRNEYNRLKYDLILRSLYPAVIKEKFESEKPLLIFDFLNDLFQEKFIHQGKKSISEVKLENVLKNKGVELLEGDLYKRYFNYFVLDIVTKEKTVLEINGHFHYNSEVLNRNEKREFFKVFKKNSENDFSGFNKKTETKFRIILENYDKLIAVDTNELHFILEEKNEEEIRKLITALEN